MDAHARLRTYALNDLRRLIPHAHYWMREHSPQADRELTNPLLIEPVRFELTPRERDAAQALADLATYELRFRAIFSRAFPVQDFDPAAPFSILPGMTEDEEREVAARREVLRRSALVYARTVMDDQLTEAFQPLPAAATESDIARKRLHERQEKVTSLRDDAIITALIARGIDPLNMPAPPLGKVAWPLRVEISRELNLTKAQANESFTRLRKDGRMSH